MIQLKTFTLWRNKPYPGDHDGVLHNVARIRTMIPDLFRFWGC